MSERSARVRILSSPWAWFAAVLGAYAITALQQIDLPGVYMDAVNPDYLVVRLINPDHADIVAWALRGNFLFGRRAPILIALYHGPQQFWLGLPFFWLFGTSVTGLRMTHAMFGVAILAALFALLIRGRLRPWQAAAACVALALDPTFSYAFRTQSYITLAPCAWLLLSLTLLLPSREGESSRRSWFWSGVFLGLAAVGYFIYAFFAPALLAFIAIRWRAMTQSERSAIKPLRSWIMGTALGGSAYVLGLFLAARESNGLAGFISFLIEQESSLGAFGSDLTLWARIEFAWRMTLGIVENAWHHAMMFGEWTPVPWSALKVAIVVAGPYAVWIVAEYQRRANALLRVLVLLPISFFMVALVFGGRLGGHHFVSLVPIFYAALAVGLASMVTAGTVAAQMQRLATIVPFIVVAAVNVAGQLAEARVLAATRGNGLFSDAINRFAEDLNTAQVKPSVFTPDWGLALPIVFLTHGNIPVNSVEDFSKAKRTLCSGRDVAVALIEGDHASRRSVWERELGRKAAGVVPYRQADGKVVFDLVTFSGDAGGPACPGARTSACAGDDCNTPAAR